MLTEQECEKLSSEKSWSLPEIELCQIEDCVVIEDDEMAQIWNPTNWQGNSYIGGLQGIIERIRADFSC